MNPKAPCSYCQNDRRVQVRTKGMKTHLEPCIICRHDEAVAVIKRLHRADNPKKRGAK